MRSGFKQIGLFNLAAIAAAVAWGRPTRPNMEDPLGMMDFDPGTFNYTPARGSSSKYAPRYSRYMPHQGLQERARRRGQMAKIAAKKEA
jgi:hypothetical protein